MKSLFIIVCNPKDKKKIKPLLEKDYHVEASASVHDSTGFLAKKRFDMVLYDTDHTIPL